MMVVDACALIEVLLGTRLGKQLGSRLFDGLPTLHVPHLADLEVLQVLRALVLAKGISPDVAHRAVATLRDLDLVRHPHEDLVPRIFELRHNLTAYDAAYLALAEALDVPLVTSDRAFDRVPGRRAVVEFWK